MMLLFNPCAVETSHESTRIDTPPPTTARTRKDRQNRCGETNT